MLERQRHDTGTYAAASALRLAAGILLAAVLTGSAAGAEQAGDAAAQANNPLANMTALNFQDYYIGRITDTDKDGNQFWVRFAKPFEVAGTSWLMRASLPVNTYPVATGGAQATGIGDLNVFAAYLFDTGNPAVSFGLGPQITAPTAPDERLGSEKWSAGFANACLDIPALELGAGEQIFLHGPSGSGKSTLLNLLAGVLLPRTGTIAVLGQSFDKLSSSARDRFRADHIGLIFQQFNLIPYLSVMDNVLLPCRFSRRRHERAGAMHEAAERLLRHLDLEPGTWHRPATALSVGQQQRVAAARALIGTPELVIADEPTSALDAERQRAFLDLLAAECSAAGAALVFVSHDRRLAGRFSRELALTEINHA